MNTTLVIMAAGIGSNLNVRIKQLEAVRPSGEIIMENSIYSALKLFKQITPSGLRIL